MKLINKDQAEEIFSRIESINKEMPEWNIYGSLVATFGIKHIALLPKEKYEKVIDFLNEAMWDI